MTVLILSAIPDVHAQAVMNALAAQGASAELLDLSEFPTQLAPSIACEDGKRRFEFRRRGGGALDLDSISAVWWRGPQSFRPTEGMEEAHRRFVISAAMNAFQGLHQALHAFWINEPARDAMAARKPYQLALAQKIGLEIPLTLVAHDVDEARRFLRKHEGEVIYKQFMATSATWRETPRLKPDDESFVEAAAHGPVIFQQHVPAVADLRVMAIGKEFFAAAADVRDAVHPQDASMNLDAKYAAHELPPEIKAKLGALMKRLGLVYGAIDLRLTPEGSYVFQEINPAGQFVYIENATGQPIAATLARTLSTKHAA